jgi:antimicrobial peptide system SdpA family protein
MSWHYRRLGLFGLALGLVWLAVCAYALHGALPYNPITLPFEARAHTQFWLPEGWAFFTRDPRSDLMLLFRKGSEGWVSASRGPNSALVNTFGLNRAARAQSVEAGLLLNSFPDSVFKDCRDAVVACFERVAVAGSLKNTSPYPTLCGDVAIAMQRPVPWAWVASGHPVTMPSHVVRLDVACP